MLHARRGRFLLVAYALVLGVEAGGNVWINFIGKGRTWDLYPLAQAFWVACSVVVVIVLARRPSMKRLAGVVIVLMFLDSFVDVCAMGGECWWAGPPVLVQWEWDALRARGEMYRYLYAYWAVTWGMQVPLRCFAIAWVLCGASVEAVRIHRDRAEPHLAHGAAGCSVPLRVAGALRRRLPVLRLPATGGDVEPVEHAAAAGADRSWCGRVCSCGLEWIILLSPATYLAARGNMTTNDSDFRRHRRD